MTRRPGWAEKIVDKQSVFRFFDKPGNDTTCVLPETCARLLKQEHARTLRVVKQAKRKAYFEEATMNEDQLDAYIAACDDIKAALQRGRT